MNRIWVDIIGTILGFGLLKAAITGEFRSSGRGGNRPLLATVKSVPVRFGIGLLALALLVCSIGDWLRKASN